MRRALLAALVAGTLALTACGSDDDTSAGGTATAAPTETTSTGGATTAPAADVDCEQVAKDVAVLLGAAQVLPQLDEASDLTDGLGPNPDTVRDATARLRPLVGGTAAAFLDDLDRAADLVEEGRTGDAATAITELQALTGGSPPFASRIVDVSADVEAAGCRLG